ncbi:MAG: 16S rRNA (cytosine(1402)-N(4))-methyltransferase RsmH [Paludibacteraceae bacterium]|nr:16S rRNA (cytosine(1402)-N(4))-methyltransferase RsmH [Paludibacteraceae bacterium]
MGEVYHIPALLEPTIHGLNIQSDGIYVDVTFGGGGHSRAIMQHLGENGQLYSFDQDADAYRNRIDDPRWHFVHGNFRYLKNFMDFYHVAHINGLLADLGVSFHHFDEAERGFSFRFAGPLDMRMNQQANKTAEDIINTYTEEDLARILYLYGELNNSRQLAHKIVVARSAKSITRIEELINITSTQHRRIDTDISGTELDIDPRTKKDLSKLFQALRIEVNDELAALREMLQAAQTLLVSGGRIAILTYHSLEDRIVKNFLKSGNMEGIVPKDFYGNSLSPFLVLEKGLSPDAEEIERNPRSRSAKLRIAEKIVP